MTSAVLEAPPGRLARLDERHGVGGRRLSLEERLHASWRAAQRDGVGECPVCRATLRPQGAAARCEACNAVIT
jgi:hypothetical protein